MVHTVSYFLYLNRVSLLIELDKITIEILERFLL